MRWFGVFFLSSACLSFLGSQACEVPYMQELIQGKYSEVYDKISNPSYDRRELEGDLTALKAELGKSVVKLNEIIADDSQSYEDMFSLKIELQSEKEIIDKILLFSRNPSESCVRDELEAYAKVYGGNIADIIYLLIGE